MSVCVCVSPVVRRGWVGAELGKGEGNTAFIGLVCKTSPIISPKLQAWVSQEMKKGKKHTNEIKGKINDS